jgi:acetyltransferase-like isoleucine patch superfamily enzyme
MLKIGSPVVVLDGAVIQDGVIAAERGRKRMPANIIQGNPAKAILTRR